MPQAGYDLQRAAQEWADGNIPSGDPKAPGYRRIAWEAFVAGAHYEKQRLSKPLDVPPTMMRPDVEIMPPVDYVKLPPSGPPSALSKLITTIRSRF
jgi:hypothetical protein